MREGMQPGQADPNHWGRGAKSTNWQDRTRQKDRAAASRPRIGVTSAAAAHSGHIPRRVVHQQAPPPAAHVCNSAAGVPGIYPPRTGSATAAPALG
jgi:hypothetical protein